MKISRQDLKYCLNILTYEQIVRTLYTLQGNRQSKLKQTAIFGINCKHNILLSETAGNIVLFHVTSS